MEKESEGEDDDTFMARVCQPALNYVNEDLTFTTEVPSEFKDNRLPTLDFTMWLGEDQKLSHAFFEKEMKSQLLIEKESAMGSRQKFCILANELTRRIYNIDENDKGAEAEITETIENFSRQAKNSGWEVKDVREMVISGYRGWERRKKRRLEEGKEAYPGKENTDQVDRQGRLVQN